MTQISIKDQIKKLVDLQKIDAEIYNVQAGLTEKPALIEESKKKFESVKANLNQLEEKFKGIQLKRKGLELEMKSKEDDIVKANTQLTQLKTNKEYQIKLNEIASIKADKSIIEEKILLSYDEADAVQGEIAKEKVVVEAQEKRYLARKKEIETLSLLGASPWYIRAPFVYEGVLYGLSGAFLGWGTTYVVLLYLTPNLVEFLKDIPLFPVPLLAMLVVLAGELVLGTILGVMASLIATRRYGR